MHRNKKDEEGEQDMDISPPHPPTSSQKYQPPKISPAVAAMYAKATIASVPPISYAQAVAKGTTKQHIQTTSTQYTPTPITPISGTTKPAPSRWDIQSKQPTAPQTTTSVWPESLRQYVHRVYEQSHDWSKQDQDILSEALKSLITQHIRSGTLHSTDWSVMAIPFSPHPTKPASTVSLKHRYYEKKPPTEKELEDLKKQERAERFKSTVETPSTLVILPSKSIIGASQKLEKSYLRLTSAPDPAMVRPLHILTRSIELIKEKWFKDHDYSYFCDQLKSIRQDLTVQNIRNLFTIHVYECHARVAIIKNDLGEYNQCQTQLVLLYNDIDTYDDEYISNDPDSCLRFSDINQAHPMEFLTYRILYFIHTQNHAELSKILSNLKFKHHPMVKYALSIRQAVALSDYHALCGRLWKECPYYLCKCFMSMFLDRERLRACKMMCSSYRPSLETSYIADILSLDEGFDAWSVKMDLNDIVTTIKYDSGNAIRYLDTKASLESFTERLAMTLKKIDIKGQIH